MAKKKKVVKNKRDQLNLMQEKFCVEYVLNGLHGTKAAITAGYSSKTAEVQASKLLTKVKILERIAELRKTAEEEASKKFKVDAAWVIQRFIDISNRCMSTEPVLNSDGVPTGEYVFDSSGANKATDCLGKIFGVYEKDNTQKGFKIKVGFK